MPMIELVLPDGSAEAYLAQPEGGAERGPWAGVLLYMDAIGLRPQIERIADRIASWGYVVLAPNLFYRTGTAAEIAPSGDLREPGERERFLPTVRAHMEALTAPLSVADTAVYVATLRALPEVAPGPLGVVGFCMGARLATRAAGDHPDQVAAVGGFHGGGLVTDADDSPHRSLATARAEFVYGHADNDGSMPPEAVTALGEALETGGLRATNEVYAGAPHGYTMADTSMYDSEAAERAFAELRGLFGRTLGSASDAS